MLWCAGISSPILVGQEQIHPPGDQLLHFPHGCQANVPCSVCFLRENPFSDISPLEFHHRLLVFGAANPFPWQRQTKWEQPVRALTHTFINWLPHIVFSWKRERKRYCLFIQWQLKGLVLERRNKNLFNKWVKIERGRKKEWGILAQLSLYSSSSPSPCCQFPILSGWLSLNAHSLVNHCAQRSLGLTSIWIAPHFSSFTPTKGSPTIAHN